MIFCDACGTKHEGTSYLCTTCGFWVNQNCADSLPSTIKLNNNPHPLTLIYSIPFETWPICAICNKRVECKQEFNLVDSGITASNNKLSRFPLLLSGEKEFVYESHTPLSSSSGSIEGSFTFVSGRIRLSVEIPPVVCEDCYKSVMNEFMKQSKQVFFT
ncbi:unnamed protein product [Camellia sinensis]